MTCCSSALRALFAILLLLLSACQNNMVIINDVEEREANEIVVFLASRNIQAHKIVSTSAGPGTTSTSAVFTIAVDSSKATDAMALLNQNGFPRKKSTTLLELFAKQGLMSSEKEETIRYQAGLAEQIAGTIRKIDGVIDADVQLSFPPAESGLVAPGQQPQQKVTASVYVKHQGILDDPNSHLVTKIKRLVSGSVNGLDVNDVTVIPDRSRFTDITMGAASTEALSFQPKEYVSIWSIVMNKQSAGRFRFLFFILTFAFVVFAVLITWLIWKFYPILRKQGGWKALLNSKPMQQSRDSHEELDE